MPSSCKCENIPPLPPPIVLILFKLSNIRNSTNVSVSFFSSKLTDSDGGSYFPSQYASLYLLLGEYRMQYSGVFSRHPNVIAVEEVATQGFSKVFLNCMDVLLGYVGSRGFICFCVDDLIFIDQVNFR